MNSPIGDIDTARMARDTGMHEKDLKAILGIAPTTAGDARAAYEYARASKKNGADILAAFKLWAELCSTALEYKFLFREMSHLNVPAALKSNVLKHMLEITESEISCAKSFDAALQGFEAADELHRLHFSNNNTALNAMRSDAAEKMLNFFRTAAEARTLYDKAWGVFANEGRKKLCEKWAAACENNNHVQITEAFERIAEVSDTIVSKRLALLGTAADAQRLYKRNKHHGGIAKKALSRWAELAMTVEDLKLVLKECAPGSDFHREVIFKMAGFYTKDVG